ncbi:hypothetical protein LPU83_pLPU83c_0646 (plasmid) [Rhizobium favelukesii]|uniref:Uncharacterized protein n=1 Tax=Rhizobium favelukesii TaxID=348824 RepID=W6RQS4_9HYPH|nr:hypothetical protein LPU83_pLPU83c_0646 [Rhizobium favelukesii]
MRLRIRNRPRIGQLEKTNAGWATFPLFRAYSAILASTLDMSFASDVIASLIDLAFADEISSHRRQSSSIDRAHCGCDRQQLI